MLRVFVFALVMIACASPVADERAAQLRSVLVRADEVQLRSRPSLVAGKYGRMASSPYDFYRGSLALFREDWERGVASKTNATWALTRVAGLGDPHPENFGILVAEDGTGGFEPNDFDAADRVPALFDLRRLTVGIALAARVAGLDAAASERIARETATAWHSALTSGVPGRITSAGGEPVLDDLFRRSQRDLAERAELEQLTRDGLLIRGPPDPAEPSQTLLELPAAAKQSVSELVSRLGPSFAVKDAARQLGTGVASWPRIRVLLLVDGPTAANRDDVVLELKELTESPLAGWYAPFLPADEAGARVILATRAAWARPDADPRWVASVWSGFPVQLRTESEANKGVNVSRLTGARGTESAIAGLGRAAASVLARVHAGPVGPADDLEAFAAEQGLFSAQYAQQVLDDHARFVALLAEVGPTLGFVPKPDDAAPLDFIALVGGP